MPCLRTTTVLILAIHARRPFGFPFISVQFSFQESAAYPAHYTARDRGTYILPTNVSQAYSPFPPSSIEKGVQNDRLRSREERNGRGSGEKKEKDSRSTRIRRRKPAPAHALLAVGAAALRIDGRGLIYVACFPLC